MRTVSFYDKATGELTGQRYQGSEKWLDEHLPEGLGYIDGAYDAGAFRIENGVAVARVVPPGFVWHAPTAAFIEQSKLDAARRDAEARAEIDRLERSQHRPQRELGLGYSGARDRLQAIDDRINELRKELAPHAR